MSSEKAFNVFLVLLLIIGIAFTIFFVSSYLNAKLNSHSVKNSPSSPPIKITYENIEQMLSKNSMIKALPDNSVLLLKFYNFNSGSREFEKSYILKNSGVKEGTIENPDMAILIHSKYIDSLTTSNFCSMIKTAKANGDLGTESPLSTPALLWKFKSMMKYKNCFGM